MTTLKWIVSLPYLVSISFALHICKWVHEHHRLNELNSTLHIFSSTASLNITHIWLCSDSQVLVRAISSNQRRTELFGVLSDTDLLISSSFVSYNFSFISRFIMGQQILLRRPAWCTRLSPLGSSSNQAPFDEKYLLTKKRVLQHIHTFKVKLQIRNKKRKWSEELPVVSRPTSTLYVSIKFRTFDHSAFFFLEINILIITLTT